MQYYAIGPCTRPFEKGEDNGGATAQGVTKDSILVVALIPPAAGDLSPQNGGIKNQATGANGRSENATYDDDALLSSVYNLWGRTIKYEFVTSTGSDEAAQRADAIAVLAEEAVRRHRHRVACTRRAERRRADLRRRHRRRQGTGEPDAAHHRADVRAVRGGYR